MTSSMLGPVGCAKFNSSFLYYIGFFLLLIIGYMWGKKNGQTKGKSTSESKSSNVSKSSSTSKKSAPKKSAPKKSKKSSSKKKK